MDRDWGSKPGSAGVASATQSNVDRRSRLAALALETVDLNKVIDQRSFVLIVPSPQSVEHIFIELFNASVLFLVLSRLASCVSLLCAAGPLLHEESPRFVRVQALLDHSYWRGQLFGAHSRQAPSGEHLATRYIFASFVLMIDEST